MTTEDIQRNIAASEPKRNIRICGHEDRTVLFCEECRTKGYEYDEMKHAPLCRTGAEIKRNSSN